MINDRELEQFIKNTITAKPSGDTSFFYEQVKPKTVRFHFDRFKFAIITLALILTLVFTTTGPNVPEVIAASVITIDINPSITLTVDAENVIIRARGVNIEGEEILNGTAVVGMDLFTAIPEIIQVANELGYIVDSDTLMLGIENADVVVRDELELSLRALLESHDVVTSKQLKVISEQFEELLGDDDDIRLTQAHLSLIQELLNLPEFSNLSIEELEDMDVDDLSDVLEEYYGIDIDDILDDDEHEEDEHEEDEHEDDDD